jgi:hypothetical protein
MDCLYCQSGRVVRFGFSKTHQRWRCQNCGHTFLDGAKILSAYRTPREIVALSARIYYEGFSISAIRKYIVKNTGRAPSGSSILRWINTTTKSALVLSSHYQPLFEDNSESVNNLSQIEVTGFELIEKIDLNSGYIIYSTLSRQNTRLPESTLINCEILKSEGRRTKEIEAIFSSHSNPEVACINFGIREPKFLRSTFANILIRNQALRWLKDEYSAQLFLQGWNFNHNYFGGADYKFQQTPAELAGMNWPYRTWVDLLED